MRLPKALRQARSAHYGYQGFSSESQFAFLTNGNRGNDTVDAMRGSRRLAGDQTANIEAIAQAAERGNHQRRG